MSEEVEISVVLKLPKGHYQVASGLTGIYDYANFDEYVSETIKENVEMLLEGTEPLDDYISRKERNVLTQNVRVRTFQLL